MVAMSNHGLKERERDVVLGSPWVGVRPVDMMVPIKAFGAHKHSLLPAIPVVFIKQQISHSFIMVPLQHICDQKIKWRKLERDFTTGLCVTLCVQIAYRL